MTTLSLARIQEEGRALIAEAVASEPAKVVARKIGVTPRHVRNLATGECSTGWDTFMALASHYPQVGAFVARCLALNPPANPEADRALAEIRRLVASLPEEGDQVQR